MNILGILLTIFTLGINAIFLFLSSINYIILKLALILDKE